MVNTPRQLKPLEDSSIGSVQDERNEHADISHSLFENIEFLKSSIIRTMVETYCQSDAKSWIDFVNSKVAIEYSDNIFYPLSQYNPDGKILKGSADRLVNHIYHIYYHLKRQHIPQDCCLQLELRSIYDKCKGSVQETPHEKAIEQYMENVVISINDVLEKCIFPLNGANNNYKRYEILSIESKPTSSEATKAHTISSSAKLHGYFCLRNSTVTAAEFIDKYCNDGRKAMITTSFQAYHDGINVYLYINDVNGKLFGRQIFKNDLLSTLPSLFQVTTIINKQIKKKLEQFHDFKPDEGYKQYEASILQQQNIKNRVNEDTKSCDNDNIDNQDDEMNENIYPNPHMITGTFDSELLETKGTLSNLRRKNEALNGCNKELTNELNQTKEKLEKLKKEMELLKKQLFSNQLKPEIKSQEALKKKKGKKNYKEWKREADDYNFPYPAMNKIKVSQIEMKESEINEINQIDIIHAIRNCDWRTCYIYHSKYPPKTNPAKLVSFLNKDQFGNKIKNSINPLKDCCADEILFILKNYAFDEIKDDKVKKYKQEILSYFEANKIDGKSLINMGKNEFGKSVMIHNKRNTKLDPPSKKLFIYLIKFDYNRLNENKGKLNLIPFVMNDDKSYWIEYLMIINMQNCVNIGVSIRYNDNNDENKVKITGIHLNKAPIIKRHKLISPNQQTSSCLDSANFVVDRISFVNPKKMKWKMEEFRAKYHLFRPFVYKFIDEMQQNPNDDYQGLREEAEFIVKCDKDSVSN